MENVRISKKTLCSTAYNNSVSKEKSAYSEMAQSRVEESTELPEIVSELQQAINDYNNSLFGNLRQ